MSSNGSGKEESFGNKNSHVVSLLDSLPYVDDPPGEAYEELAIQLVEKEMKEGSLTEYEVPGLRLRSPIMQDAYRRAEEVRSSGAPQEKSMDLNEDYDEADLKPPLGDSIEEWEEAVRRAKVAYEKQRLRSMTNTVAKEESVDLWKEHNTGLHDLKRYWEGALERQQKSVNELNHAREEFQKNQELPRLEIQRDQLVAKIFQLRSAVDVMKTELTHSD